MENAVETIFSFRQNNLPLVQKDPGLEKELLAHRESIRKLALESDSHKLVDEFQRSCREFYARQTNGYWKDYHRIGMEEYSSEMLRRLVNANHSDVKL